LAALLRAINHESPSIRREALSIVQNLQDRVVVDAVLEQLQRESDPPTRLALLESLGKLSDAVAVPALVGEITAAGSDDAVVREAARAIARIASKGEPKADLASSAAPLRARYEGVAAEQTELQAALLTAMAGVADPSFAPDFAAAIDSEDPTILQAAISGLAALGDGAKLARMRALATHADPRVRLAAIEAIAVLGGEDADLEVLQARLFPNVEANELVLQAAWKAWRDFMAKRPVPEQIRATERLRELPELEARYLDELETSLEASGNHKAALQDVRQRLVQLLVAAGKHAEAVPHLRDLYEASAARSDPQTWSIGLRWLDAVLKTPSQQGLADLIMRLGRSASDDDQRAKIVAAVRAYVESPAIAGDPDRARRLSADLATVDAAGLGSGWKDLLAALDSRLKSANTGPAG
jgi:HEAT repeat protein